MKILAILVLLCTTVLAQSGGEETVGNGTLVVEINGIENDEGRMMVALCNSAENFSDSDSAFAGAQVQINSGVAMINFNSIPFGEYAIKTFHDEDSNGELDTNFLGIPSESYGFSNNASGSFGPPSWDQAKFTFNQPIDSIFISVE